MRALVAGLLLAFAAPADAAETVRAGSLTAEVTASPFSVRLVQPDGPAPGSASR